MKNESDMVSSNWQMRLDRSPGGLKSPIFKTHLRSPLKAKTQQTDEINDTYRHPYKRGDSLAQKQLLSQRTTRGSTSRKWENESSFCQINNCEQTESYNKTPRTSWRQKQLSQQPIYPDDYNDQVLDGEKKNHKSKQKIHMANLRQLQKVFLKQQKIIENYKKENELYRNHTFKQKAPSFLTALLYTQNKQSK